MHFDAFCVSPIYGTAPFLEMKTPAGTSRTYFRVRHQVETLPIGIAVFFYLWAGNPTQVWLKIGGDHGRPGVGGMFFQTGELWKPGLEEDGVPHWVDPSGHLSHSQAIFRQNDKHQELYSSWSIIPLSEDFSNRDLYSGWWFGTFFIFHNIWE